jgi:hypothetical protein
MKAPIVICLATLLCASAQEPVDLEARRQSVATLERHLEMRQKRFDEVAAEIRQRGEATDKKVGELVEMLAGLKDSESSKRRVSDIKGEAIAGLKRMIEVYQRERRTLVETLRTDGDAPAEALKKDMATIDALTEKRVAQIVELVKSMPGGQDIQKYESAGGTYYNGFYEEETRISEAWRQNRRDRVESEKQRREAQQALEKSIADLERRQATLKGQLAGGKLTAPEAEIFEHELGYVTNLIGQRKTQLMEVTAPASPPGEDASKGEADDLKRLFDDARRDIAGDFTKTLKLYHAAAAEREKIHAARENLEARKKWLAENDPAAKKGE